MAPKKVVDTTDGVAYTKKQFIEFYGEKKANKIWEKATAPKDEGKGKGKGKGKGAAPKAKAKAKAKANTKPEPVFDYSGLEKGMRVQAKSAEDGVFYAAEVVTVSNKPARKGAPVQVNFVGYTNASNEWVGGASLRSKNLKKRIPSKFETLLPKNLQDVIKKMPMGHDLTLASEHETYMKLADSFYKMPLAKLREIEKATSQTQSTAFKYPTMYHIALKNAISKKLFDKLPDVHCTVVFALYKENNRILPKGDEEGKSHKNGEDFVRRKHKQMTWLFSKKPKSSWELLGVDDGCPFDSCGMMMDIAKSEGYTNVECHKLKEAITSGKLDGKMDVQKLKSEAWTTDDKLVKASQKAGAILTGLDLACQKDTGDKRHIIVYTDSDLSTDLALCGLNFDAIINGKVEASVSQRFGQPCAVNCGKLMTEEEGGGIAPGMPKESMIHLSLRHKLRQNLLPPLKLITDTNCGHKALTPDTAKGTVSMVKDYKGSFDIDWLVCVGVVAKANEKKPIKTTAIPWVNSVGESNFWSAPSGDEDAAAQKLKSATSWHGIFKTMCDMYGWHKEGLEKLELVTEESKAYVEWVSGMDVNAYMKLSDALLEKLKDKTVNMPEKSIMDMSLEDMKKLAA